MSSENDEAVNILLTKLLKERYCYAQNNDYEACVANYVPLQGDGSYVEQSLQRKGRKICDPYMNVLQQCMQDEKKHHTIMKHASQQSECKAERQQYMKCQRLHASSGASEACEQEAREMLMCGLAFMLQKNRQRQQQRQHQ